MRCVYEKAGKRLPMALALYAVTMFTIGPSVSALAHASILTSGESQSQNARAGIWVQLCASGQSVFISLVADVPPSKLPQDDHSITACHACADRRGKTGAFIIKCLAAG